MTCLHYACKDTAVMKPLRFFLVLLVSFLTKPAFAQTQDDYLGEWMGYITQEPRGIASRYYFALDLRRDGDNITGEAHIALEDDPKVYGYMELEGHFEESGIVVTELFVNREQLYSYMYWCLKTYRLTAFWDNNGMLVLQGTWQSDACGETAGAIHLERRLS